MACRADQPRYVAVERLDLDDVSAVIAEHLGRIGPHQHGRHVYDLDALERSHGSVCSRCAHFRARHYFWGLVTAGRREDQGQLPYGRMRELKQRCDPGPRLNISCHRPRRRTIQYSSLALIGEGLWDTGCPLSRGMTSCCGERMRTTRPLLP